MYSMRSPSSRLTIRSMAKLVRPKSETSSKRRESPFHSRRVRSTGWFSNTMMLSNNDCPPCPAQRWISLSGVCWKSRMSRLQAWISRSQSPTLASVGTVLTTGKVLMNNPSMFSEPLSVSGRPDTVAPKVTVRWPV
ncbi:hypothetical protein D3C72_1335590 [compost metagenome]